MPLTKPVTSPFGAPMSALTDAAWHPATDGTLTATVPAPLQTSSQFSPALESDSASSWISTAHPEIESFSYAPSRVSTLDFNVVVPRRFDASSIFTNLPRVDPVKRANKAQELRNEVVMITEKFVTYFLVASVEMKGMFLQRLFSENADKVPLYNPDAPLPEFPDLSWDNLRPGTAWELVRYVDARILRFFGETARQVFLDDDFRTIMADPKLRESYGFSGDRWYSIGNLMKFTAQYVFSYFYRGELGLYKWMDGIAATSFSPEQRRALTDAFAKLESKRNWLEKTRAMTTILGKHLPHALAIGTKNTAKTFASAGFWIGLPVRAGKSALGVFGNVSTAVSDKLALAGKGMTTLSKPGIVEEWAPTVLTAEESATRLKIRQDAGTAPTAWERFKVWIRGKRSDANVVSRVIDRKLTSFADSKEIETTLANASAKSSFATATEKLMKFVAPTVAAASVTTVTAAGFDADLSYAPALPLLALAHGAILYSVYYTVQGTVPKILQTRGKPRKLNIQQELLARLGIYLGKGIQSAYTLWITGGDILDEVTGGNTPAKELYTDFLQAGKNMPDMLVWAGTAFAVGPAIYSAYNEAHYLRVAVKDAYDKWDGDKGIVENLTALKKSDTETFSEIDRIISHGFFGTAVTGTALAGAWYMGDTQTQPLAWLLCGLSAAITGFRSIHKHKEQIKESFRKRLRDRNVERAEKTLEAEQKRFWAEPGYHSGGHFFYNHPMDPPSSNF